MAFRRRHRAEASVEIAQEGAADFWSALRESAGLYEAMVPEDLWDHPASWLQLQGPDGVAANVVNKRQVQVASRLLFAYRDAVFKTAPEYGSDLMGNPLILSAPVQEIVSRETFQNAMAPYRWDAAPEDLQSKNHALLLHEEATKKVALGFASLMDGLRDEGPRNPMWPDWFVWPEADRAVQVPDHSAQGSGRLPAAPDDPVEASVPGEGSASGHLDGPLAEATSDDIEIRRRRAWMRYTQPDVARILAADKDLEVRRGVAGCRFLPADLAQHFATDEDAEIRARAAWHQDIPVEMLRHLATDDDARVRRGVLGRFDGMPGLRGIDELRGTHRTPISPDLLNLLASDSEALVRYTVATHPEAPADVLMALASDTDVVEVEAESSNQDPEAMVLVATGVAENAKTPPEALRMMAKSPVVRPWQEGAPLYLRSLIGNPNTPIDALEELIAGMALWRLPGSIRHDLWLRVVTESTKSKVLSDVLGQYDEAEVRVALIANPCAPPESLRSFAQDPEFSVRLAVAECARTPSDVLSDLLGSQGLAGLSVEELRWWDNAREDLDLALAANPDAPTEVLVCLARNISGDVRKEIAAHTNTPHEVLIGLMADPDPEVRQAAASNPNHAT